MTPREKKLAALTGIMTLLLCGYFIWSQVSTALKTRRDAIGAMDIEISKKQATLKRGRQATRRLVEYENRSLPADREVARSLYQGWLLDLLKQAELEEANVKAQGDYTNEGAYQRLTFTASGVGRLDQIVDLLRRFYEFDHLHRIPSLKLVPIKDSRNLDVSFRVEAAVLPGSVNQDQLTSLANPWLADGDAQKMVDAIIGRNIFAPPNHAPTLSSIGSKRAEVKRSLSFTAKANDPDPLDTVTYALGDAAPAGAKISAASGQFSWTPKEIGEFDFEIVAKDDGIPSKSARQMVSVTVVEPPPKVATNPPPARPRKLDFDIAKHTYLIGTTERGGQWEIWLRVRTTGKTHKLRPGDTVSFGSIDGKVARIGERDAEITVGDDRIIVRIGENLFEADKLPIGGI